MQLFKFFFTTTKNGYAFGKVSIYFIYPPIGAMEEDFFMSSNRHDFGKCQ